MEISTAITAAIEDLISSIDHDSTFLSDPLALLGEHLQTAVDSALGLELTLHAHGQPLTLRSWAPEVRPSDVTTSLHLPASALLTPTHLGGFTFWAGAAGAFVDLAADLTHALSLAVDTIRLDEHLDELTIEHGLFGLTEATVINQAVGALIAGGHHPAAARAELQRAAAQARIPLAAQARQTLIDLA